MSTQSIASTSSSQAYQIPGWGSSEWRQSIQGVLDNPTLSPKDLIDVLSQDYILKECYLKSAGVGEGYSVGKHTLMVLETAQRYRNTFENSVTKTVPWNHFLLFLALHDIGKGVSRETLQRCGLIEEVSIYYIKESELDTTRSILKQVMEDLKISPNEIALFSSMLMYDTQGAYLLEKINESGAFDNILEMARNCSANPVAFYELFSAFHAIDAASYPFLFQRIFREQDGNLVQIDANKSKIDALAEKLRKAVEGESVFKRLMDDLSAEVNPDSLMGDFFKNIEELTLFLKRMNKQMLSQTSEHSPNKLEYESVQKGFGKLFACFISHQGLQQKYRGFLYSYLGLYESNCYIDIRSGFFRSATIQRLADVQQAPSGALENAARAIVEEAVQFHRNYMCRYEQESLKQYTNARLDEMQDIRYNYRQNPHTPTSNDKESASKKKIEVLSRKSIEESLALLRLTFVHGSNSAIFCSLWKTAQRLIPTTQLLAAGVVPLTGELGSGLLRSSTGGGVNNQSISSTSIDSADYVIKQYASRESFYYKDPLPTVEKFLKEAEMNEHSFNDEQDIHSAHSYANTYLCLLRLKAVNSEAFESLKPQLSKVITQMKNGLQKVRQQLEKTGKIQVNYWLDKLECNENVVADLLECLNKSVISYFSPPDSFYPVVFASHTAHTEPQNLMDPTERTLKNWPLLGRDIQVVFVPAEEVKNRREEFELDGLKKPVSVLPLEALSTATTVNLLASPLLADVASLYKNLYRDLYLDGIAPLFEEQT